MFFKKNKKEKEEKKQEQANNQEPPKIDPSVRPGGVFMVQLFMKEQCEMPSNERLQEVLSKYLGRVEQIGDREIMVGFAAMDYIAQFKDGKQAPVQVTISSCDEFDESQIDDFKRSQMWACMNDRDRILSECKYNVLATDMLGGALPPLVRANMLMDYLEALVELYPQCEAVYSLNSGKLILADEIRKKERTGAERFIKFIVNARFFNIQGTNDSIVDTLGLSLLYIEDLQYHFHDMDPNQVVAHAYNMADYLLNNNNPIKDGDTIDSIKDEAFVPDIQWKCHYENALVQPSRVVIDVNMGEYAAGARE